MRSILAYGASAGLLIAFLKYIDYRFLVIDHSVQIYGALVAALFSAVGIWFGLKLTKEKVIVKHIEVAVPAAPFVFDQTKADALALTPREIEVLGLMAEGLSNKQMAERLFVSENTIKTHCSRLFDKLGAGRRTQAVQIAKQHDLLP